MKVIDETESDLRRLIENSFGAIDPTAKFESVLIDWLHLVARQIPARPRVVIASPEVEAVLSDYPAVATIASALRAGENMRPWLSTGSTMVRRTRRRI